MITLFPLEIDYLRKVAQQRRRTVFSTVMYERLVSHGLIRLRSENVNPGTYNDDTYILTDSGENIINRIGEKSASEVFLIDGLLFDRRKWNLLVDIRSGNQVWKDRNDDWYLNNLIKNKLIESPETNINWRALTPDMKRTLTKSFYVTPHGEEIVSKCPYHFDKIISTYSEEVSELAKLMTNKSLGEEQNSVENLQRFPKMLEHRMPTVQSMLNAYNRRALAANLEAMSTGATAPKTGSMYAFKHVATAWNTGIMQAIPRTQQNALFLELRSKLPSISKEPDIDKVKKIISTLLGTIPKGTTAHDHLLLADKFIQEAEELSPSHMPDNTPGLRL